MFFRSDGQMVHDVIGDRAECNQPGYGELGCEGIPRERGDAVDPMPGDQLRVQLTPRLEVQDRLDQLLDRQPAQRLPRIAPVVRAGRLLDRDLQVDDRVLLVTHQAVAEAPGQGVRVARARNGRNGHRRVGRLDNEGDRSTRVAFALKKLRDRLHLPVEKVTRREW